MHVITSTKGVYGGGGEEEVGPLIRAATDEDGGEKGATNCQGNGEAGAGARDRASC